MITGMEIYLVIVEDRHADVEVHPYVSRDRAVQRAQGEIDGYYASRDREEGEENEGLTGPMERLGWIFFQRYGIEGDCVSVRVVTLDEQLSPGEAATQLVQLSEELGLYDDVPEDKGLWRGRSG